MTEHYKARPDVIELDEFHDALLNPDEKRDAIAERFNVSAGFVSKYRDLARAGKYPGRENAAAAPSESSSSMTNSDGTKRLEFIRNRPVDINDARDLIRQSGDNPDLFNISIRAIAYGDDKSSNKIAAWSKTGTELLIDKLPLPELYREAEKRIRDIRPVAPRARGTVVVVADPQIGKTGRRGGTPELLERLDVIRGRLDAELGVRRPEKILVLDLGDGIENFESGGNPMFTNDLSLPDQLDCYATEMWKFVRLAHEHAETEVGVVSSNHSAWRKGKQLLGKPTDDFGVFTHKQLRKLAAEAGVSVAWHFPSEWDESICVDFMGTPIGAVHGSQFGPGGAITWWEKQAFGSQAVTKADVLVTGHYHTYGAGVAGENPFTGRERMWLGAPTVDNGSDHYRLTAGRDSRPGLMIFDVTEHGFDLGSLKLL